ncbi:hypothetical protein TNCV_3685031 [Trichonephila clavipes]|uniref:Uncharacterized protein n=1 Tax=Trichonephila clavipes TaxID=2585209 RepID=A0A8X6RPZ5_TRICX|nr:hypothetical protein TNCV_3685031 [Trichonephila clavipes]
MVFFVNGSSLLAEKQLSRDNIRVGDNPGFFFRCCSKKENGTRSLRRSPKMHLDEHCTDCLSTVPLIPSEYLKDNGKGPPVVIEERDGLIF